MLRPVSGFGIAARAFLILSGLSVIALFSGCGTTRRLPTYEPPLARTEFQTVRTTAYTHTEADHLQYGQRDALGGTLRAASPPILQQQTISPTGYVDAPSPSFPAAGISSPGALRDEEAGFHPPPGSASVPMARAVPATPVYLPSASVETPLVCGSAAADWSRWPAGTVFRILSTGQLYRVDDYGWALSGRNTIDLYMPSRATMNAWAVRRVSIQIVQWGDRDESLRILKGREKYRHIRRMVLELEGEHRAAARME